MILSMTEKTSLSLFLSDFLQDNEIKQAKNAKLYRPIFFIQLFYSFVFHK